MPEPFITKQEPTKVFVVHPILPLASGAVPSIRKPEDALEEAKGFCEALELEVTGTELVSIREVNPKTLLGGGKVSTLKEALIATQAELVVINTRLQPTQQRNLELALKVKVIDRTGLILEIFAARARTHAGRLQVALAQLQYQAGRLVRSWTHLERQRGGLGKTGGPGERQIELDRRIIRQKIDKIRKELAEVEKTRSLHRKNRAKSGLPVVAFVGYTNAGKSTLFNQFVGEEAFTKDMLFATLDPLMRKVKLSSGREVILSDTVGFVSDLPHELVDAFHATLEEVVNADLLLHVQDASNSARAAEEVDVENVLQSIGAEKVPQIKVYNKQDIKGAEIPEAEGVGVSALTGQGFEGLKEKIEAFFAAQEETYQFKVPASQGQKLAWLEAHGKVLKLDLDEDIYTVDVLMKKEDAAVFKKEKAQEW